MNAAENYKLYETIQTLDKKEIRQIKRVLQSPFFVLRNDVGNLFEVLVKYHLKGKSFPAKEVIFEKVFSEKEYDSIKKILGREPKGVEWALFSALWSEHCSYKSSKIHLKNQQIQKVQNQHLN